MVRVEFPEGEKMKNIEEMNNHDKSDVQHDPSSMHEKFIH